MKWRLAACSAAAGFCLFPLSGQAQDESAPQGESAPADAATPNTLEKTKDKLEETAAAVQAKGKGILGDLRIGPSVAFGIPHPITGAVDLVYADIVSLSVSGGRFSGNFQDIDVEIRNWDVALRWYPFQGSFFIGAAYGNQGLVAKSTSNVDFDFNSIPLTVPTTFRLEVESKYLTPQLGWFARWDSGFTMGFELGLQMPNGASSELQTSFKNISSSAEAVIRNSEDYKKAKDDVEEAGRTIGEQALPYITIIKLGWLF